MHNVCEKCMILVCILICTLVITPRWPWLLCITAWRVGIHLIVC